MTETTPTRTSAGRNHRARWAAIGAAVAVSLGAGGFGIANAVVSTNPKNVYVAITPCRLIDTRPAPDNVGPRATPIGDGETVTIAGTGDVAGPCNIPAGISAIETNVTAVGATTPTFLTFFASDVTQPTASNLNPAPGQPPTPNSVTINLAAAGTFNLYNHDGAVNVIIDIVGYYDNHNHSSADITNEPGVSFNFKSAPTLVNAANVVVNSTSIRVPSDGFLNIQATGSFEPLGAGGASARCQLTLGSATIDTAAANSFVASTDELPTTLSMHRTVPIARANNPLSLFQGQTVRLVCTEQFGDPTIRNVELTATFYPTEYEPIGILPVPFPLTDEVDGNAGGG
jgi:hypothetical protein